MRVNPIDSFDGTNWSNGKYLDMTSKTIFHVVKSFLTRMRQRKADRRLPWQHDEFPAAVAEDMDHDSKSTVQVSGLSRFFRGCSRGLNSQVERSEQGLGAYLLQS